MGAGNTALVSVLGWAPAMAAPLWQTLLIVTGAGWLGSLVDSLLGATLQAIYYCPTCKKQTEKHPQHTCGTRAVHERGLLWLNNDGVNFACTFSAALVGMIVLFWL